MLGFIAELGIYNTTDFRPGHVSAQTGVLNSLRKAWHSKGREQEDRVGARGFGRSSGKGVCGLPRGRDP